MADLVPRAQAGDAAARDELLRRCHGTVYRWALVHTGDSDDADDVAQEVLLRLHRYLGRYSGRSRFTTWLYQVTRNAALGWRRQLTSRLRVTRELTAERVGETRSASDPMERLHGSEIAEVVTALFRRLPARQREVFNLADIEGVALVEIAERMGLDPGTVRAHLFPSPPDAAGPHPHAPSRAGGGAWTMNCQAALDMMLEAEPAELAGQTDSELRRHIQGCASCRGAAQRILDAEGSLREALAAAAPRRTAAEAVQRAGQRQKRSRRLWPLVPLAAAAGLAGLILARRHTLELVPPASPPPSPRLAVTAPPGRSVAVLQTDNPDVVVIWFF